VLYVVATPIGNLEDISTRAVRVLAEVAMIAAEDTRRTRSLLAALSLPIPELLALHDHNEREVAGRVVSRLEGGADVALVSDAGTPLISDPGYSLVGACYAAGLPVRPIPGPSALACALSVCPLPVQDVCFLGFLPARAGARRARLETTVHRGPVAFFEAPHRVAACLADLAAIAPERRVFVGREMTKRYEAYLCDRPKALAERLERDDEYRGEFVCIVEAPVEAASTAQMPDARETMRILCGELPPAQAARVASALLGLPRRELYELALAIKDR
jgi:16S rRNA (cytidine1402-2'-O)-methyltransferase